MRKFIKSTLITLTAFGLVMAITGTTNANAYEKKKDFSATACSEEEYESIGGKDNKLHYGDRSQQANDKGYYYCLGENDDFRGTVKVFPKAFWNEDWEKKYPMNENGYDIEIVKTGYLENYVTGEVYTGDENYYEMWRITGTKYGTYTFMDGLPIYIQECFVKNNKVTKAPTLTEEGECVGVCSCCHKEVKTVLPKLTWAENNTRLESDKWFRTECDDDGVSSVWYWLEKYYVTDLYNVNGDYYFFDEDGYKVTNTWKETDNGWLYFNEDGKALKNEWLNYNGDWYYFNDNGYMATGWAFDGSNWYYLNSSGVMQTGWIFDGSNWYYLKSSGAMATGWVDDNGTWYYMNKSGAMQTGWVNDNGTWYYMNSSGAMQTGWIWDGTWYFMKDSGAMASNEWILYNDDWYYMKSSGAMASDEWIGEYYINEDGIWEE